MLATCNAQTSLNALNFPLKKDETGEQECRFCYFYVDTYILHDYMLSPCREKAVFLIGY